jgi:ATP-dependent helicase/nuclease subunit B
VPAPASARTPWPYRGHSVCRLATRRISSFLLFSLLLFMPHNSFSPWTVDAFCWQQAMVQLMDAIQERGAHPADAVVLLPYAQLMQQARQAWALAVKESSTVASVFVPRFETTMNWAGALGGRGEPYTPADADIRMDVAIDMLTAASLLQRSGRGHQQDLLASRLVEAAWSLARVAAAVPPAARIAWGERLAQDLSADLEGPVLAVEAALGRIALAWAASSSYPTDCLFDVKPAFFAVLEGFQPEPLSDALKAHFGEASLSIPLCAPGDEHAAPSLHASPDAEDEAERAAACVLAHLAQGRSPVALIAQDRLLTRRVGAMLGERGVAMRDETGWKLSTTRAAASLMGLLRAMPWDASADAVLDWLKNAPDSPAFTAATVHAAEAELRKNGVRFWRDLPETPLPAFASVQRLKEPVDAIRNALTKARPLQAWLRDLRAALQSSRQWAALTTDEAGQTVQSVLRLHEGAEAEFESSPSMTLAAFTSWVHQALEGGKFTPPQPENAQVVILPLAQLLGRPMQAVVLPGCDEIRLPVSPEPAGPWTPAQRELLGLPSRQTLASTQRQAWAHALRFAQVDVLWRTSEGGERLVPSGFVQELLLDHAIALSPDPRTPRAVAALPTPRPLPVGKALPVNRLSASAYEDLRRCPYRFFALRQLKLQEADELESELGKRDFGNWLHELLNLFHQSLKSAPAHELPARVAMINIAAEQATTALALSESEFLPFAAIWPRVREGYLAWLADHDASGAVFDAGEVWRETPLGSLTLVGKIDRIDREKDGHTLLIDYKTEPRTTTTERIKSGQEDTQLPFYAALMADDTLAAAYVNLGEKEPTKTFPQPDIVGLRDELIDSILTDMTRIEHGAVLPALGEGKACEFCAARGLCRKDFWS